ncbi:Potential queD like [hydrothermal vent metagenome]|uniref:Potential queD like n=1 Tax=hydrothermal vent metagenome TaxID=652676 RepID=A0A1W1E5E5_9ZZZZ
MNNIPETFILFLTSLFVIALLIGFVTRKTNQLRYTKQDALFTKAEINFLKTLEKIVVNPNIAIFGKVRIADIITPAKKTNTKEWWRLFRKISQKHVDYVLCNKSDYSVICVIELNDSSHNTAKAKLRDSFVRKAYQSANIELIEVKAKRYYNADKVKAHFSEKVQETLRLG